MAWLPPLFAGLVGGAALALLLTRLRRRSATRKSSEQQSPDGSSQGLHLVLNCRAWSASFDRLRTEGVDDLRVHLLRNVPFECELLTALRVEEVDAGVLKRFACRDARALERRLRELPESPWREVFRGLMLACWGGKLPLRQVFFHASSAGRHHATLASYASTATGAEAWSRIQVSLLEGISLPDSSPGFDQAEWSSILAHANILLWNARVRREGDRFAWKITVPVQSWTSPVFKLATATDMGGLWAPECVPDTLETNKRSEDAMLSGASGYQQEFRVLEGGRTHWLSEEVEIQRVGDVEWSLIGVVVDITKRREAEEAQRRSEVQLKLVLERSDMMLWQAMVTDHNGHLDWKFETASSGLLRRLVRCVPHPTFESEPGVLGTPPYGRFEVPEKPLMNQRSTAAIYRGDLGYEQQFQLLSPDGVFWVQEQVTVTPRGPGRWEVVGVAFDITARKAMEAELASEKERLSVTLRAMSEVVVTADREGLVQYANPAAAKLFRCELDALIGRPLANFLHLQNENTGAAVESPFEALRRTGALSHLPPCTVLRSQDGSQHIVEGCCAPVHNIQSVASGGVLVLRDVTNQQRLERQVERASRLESIGVLAGGIAHDFNNILTTVMGNLALALLDNDIGRETRESLNEMQAAAVRARDLTQQLLTFSKGGDPVRSAVRLPEIITEVASFSLRGSRVKCQFDLIEDLWMADADKGQLGQVVQNLVINAMQAMPEGGTLRLLARNESVGVSTTLPLTPGDYVRISIVDTGGGIRPEDLSRIFDPFFTTKRTGSGLGLATVYSIITKHKGHIEVESELGRGTTFQFWLPALPGEAIASAEPSAPTAAPHAGRVLFMDDEESIRRMAYHLLSRLGFEVVTTADGQQAVEAFEAARSAGKPFDLLIMDLTVPGGMGGVEALRLIHAVEPNLPAIASSGYSSDPVMSNCRAFGFCARVAKPYDYPEFTRVIREALKVS